MRLSFTKMQGLGNDFVVVDATTASFSLSCAQIQQMSNRRFGVGFDQLLVIEPDESPTVDFRFRIFNADGSEVEQCGNGARCAALFVRLRGLSDKKQLRFSTLADTLTLTLEAPDKVTVLMGVPQFSPESIPFLEGTPALSYPIEILGEVYDAHVVNVGNPHVVLLVESLTAELTARVGEVLSRHQRFPKGVNVGFMQVLNPQQVRLRVYERGAGETLACGSGACAAMVVGRQCGLLQERVTVSQPGGSLVIDWQGPLMPVSMTGPAARVFEGVWEG